MGGLGAVLEPLVVASLLLGGTWLNRNTNYNLTWHPRAHCFRDRRLDIEQVPVSPGSLDSSDALLPGSGAASPSLLANRQYTRMARENGAILGFRDQCAHTKLETI